MTDIHEMVQNRFNRETDKWKNYHSGNPNSVINLEIVKRKEIVKRIVQKRHSGEKIKILEVGCGTGDNLAELLDSDHNWVGHGVDISEEMIKTCNKRFQNVKFNLLNIEKETLDETFDVIVMLGVIGYLKSASKAFHNSKEMLEDEGLLIFTFGNKNSVFRKIRKLYLSWPKYKITRTIGNWIRKKILNRETSITYDRQHSHFELHTFQEIKRSLPQDYTIQEVYNIGFTAGIFGSLSMYVSHWLDKIFVKNDIFNLALTKLVVAKYET